MYLLFQQTLSRLLKIVKALFTGKKSTTWVLYKTFKTNFMMMNNYAYS
jgi:hypothetical protein